MASAAEIQAAATTAVTAQENLEAAVLAFNLQESLAQDAAATERAAFEAALLARDAALDAARNGNPDWATTLAARESALAAWLTASEFLQGLVFDGA